MNRPVLALFAAALAVLCVARPVPAESPPSLWTHAAGDDWPTFLGEKRDATTYEGDLLIDWPEAGPPIVWQMAVGEGYSMPSIADGRLFLFDRHDDRESGDRARLRALVAETGEVLWQSEYPTDYEDMFEYSGGPRASPVVDDDRVYAFGVDGRLRAHAVLDGNVLWERDTEKEFGVVQNFFGVASTPLVAGELLLVPVGGSPEGDWDIHDLRVEPNGSGIVAFDKKTGAVRWQSGDELASYSSPVLAEIDRTQHVLWLARDNFLVMDPASGTIRHRLGYRAAKAYSVNAATPVVVGNEIFLSESYEKGGLLLRLGDQGLKTVWQDPPRRNQSLATHWNTAVEHRGVLYGSSGEKTGQAELRAVDWKSGRVHWSIPRLGRTTALLLADPTPAPDDAHLIVLAEYGELLLIEATRDEPRIKQRLELRGSVDGKERELLRHPAWSPPIVSHGLLFVRGKDRLVALDLRAPAPKR